MAPSPRPQYHLDLANLPQLSQPQNQSGPSTAASSPIEQPSTGSSRQALNSDGGSLPGLNITPARRGNSSPSNEQPGSRLYNRRARELQAEGSRPVWGPPLSSGLSTPLRETIPESPGDDTFPDIKSDTLGPQRASSFRRSRAGTAPSSAFPPIGGPASASGAPGSSKSSTRPTPSTSPFRPASSSISAGIGRSNSGASITAKSALLSRIRAGSLPHKPSLLTGSSPFGPSIFSTSWIANRDRANTYSGADPGSPNSAFQRDFSDTDVKTLDYMGLADNKDSFGVNSYMANQYPSSASAIHPLIANLSNVNRPNRFRSFSVNAKEQYEADDDEYEQYDEAYTAEAMKQTQAEIHRHNLEVQAFAMNATASRPRARTAGVLDKPSSGLWRSFGPMNPGLDNNMAAARLGMEAQDYANLNDSVQAMQLQGNPQMSLMGEYEHDAAGEATSSLWLGGIPASTTSSSLRSIFEMFGSIASCRVLTQKSCGFVNYEHLESAIRARAHFNGREIFPGSGAVRIGYAKAPSASATPGGEQYPSSSPDPFVQRDSSKAAPTSSLSRTRAASGAAEKPSLTPPQLQDLRPDILDIVKELGATEQESKDIAGIIDDALRYGEYDREIPMLPEPSHTRVYDAPKLREIRKRLDNGLVSATELDDLALSMLPEIAELSYDYLGNTIVQKLFENCQSSSREAMLHEIAPHIAEIAAHRNGTWAAQKLIAIASTPVEISLIVNNARPYTATLQNDQYANYAIQGCLRFNENNFIYESMLAQLWPIAQGRFGARAARACLESSSSTRAQQLMMAAAIALHSVQLATNTNGALLLTWFLDTASFPNRRKALAPQLISKLSLLCTHKVAYTTVLKVFNQRNEPDARDMMLQALFFSENDDVLEQILRDVSCGNLLVFKVLTSPSFDEDVRGNIVEAVRRVLVRIKAQPSQGYKRLMDEVQLSTRGMSRNRDTSARERSVPRPGYEQEFTPQPAYSSTPPQNRNGNHDANMGFDPYANGSPLSAQNQQLQYQQAMLSAGRQPMPFPYNPVPANGFGSAGASPVDAYRGMPRPGMPNSGSNSYPRMGSGQMMPTQGGFTPQPSFNGGWSGQQYGGGYAMPPQQQSMMGGGGPRGRVSVYGSP